MRAPQFGRSKRKRVNTEGWSKPLRVKLAEVPAGPVVVPSYRGTVTLHLWHKRAMVKGELNPALMGPVVSIRRAPEPDRVLSPVVKRDRALSLNDKRGSRHWQWQSFGKPL